MTKPAPLTHQAPNGAAWTFDPITEKWTVSMGDQKSSSQKYDTLVAKVQKWIDSTHAAARANDARAPAKQAPAAPQLFTFGLARSLDYNSSSGPEVLLTTAIPPREKNGVTVKTSWNSKEERFDVVRYRTWSSRPSKDVPSWESSQAAYQRVINFDALDEDEQAWWRELFEHRAQVALASQARRTLDTAWMALKQDASAIYETTSRRRREQDGTMLERLDRSKVHDSSHVWMALDGCPVVHQTALTGTDGWTSDDGTWVRALPEGTLRLSFAADSTHAPTFLLEQVGTNGEAQALWSGSNFDRALALGNATAQVSIPRGTASPEAGVTGWLVDLGYGCYTSQDLREHTFGLGRFPTHVEESAAVFCETEDLRNAELMVLGREINRSTISAFTTESSRYRASRNDESLFGWHRRSKNGRSTFFLAKGPEDALLDVMADLDSLTRQAVGGFVNSLSRENLTQRLDRQTQATLKHAYDLAGDGETLSEDPTYMVNRWQDVVIREEARAAQRPTVTTFKAQCEALIERAALLLADLGHTVDLKAKATVKASGAPR